MWHFDFWNSIVERYENEAKINTDYIYIYIYLTLVDFDKLYLMDVVPKSEHV